MRVSELGASGLAMVAEQRSQSGRGHAGSAGASFQRDEEGGGAWIGPFQAQIMVEQLNGFRSERQKANLAAFAMDANLPFGKQEVIAI